MTAARAPRAAAVATVTVGLGLAAHRAGGSALPSTWLVLLLAVGASALGWWMTARERGLPVLTATVAAGQLAVHAALVVGAPGGGAHGWCGPPAAHVAHVAHHPVALLAGCHALAAWATAWWLRRGEQRAGRAARALAARASARLAAALTPLRGPAASATRRLPAYVVVVVPRRRTAGTCLPDRGPPRAQHLRPLLLPAPA